MKNTTTFTFNENKDCLVDYGLGLGKQPALLLKDVIYEVTNLKVEDGIVSFELWDDNGFIGEYSFSDEESLETDFEDTYISLDEIYASAMALRYQTVFKNLNK